MVTIPLGQSAYKREFAGDPEIRLENRFLERAPTNLREHTALLSRPGTDLLDSFAGGLNRRCFSLAGQFNGDLFVVSGPNLYRYDSAGLQTLISGIINGDGFPTIAWMKGIGYEYLFIADGLLLQFYAGGSHATGTMTLAGGAVSNQVIQIGGTYYAWNNAVDTSAPDGSASHPWLAALSTMTPTNPTGDPLIAMANLINFNGVRGTDFSTALGGPNPNFSATNNNTVPATQLIITSTSVYADGNAITTAVQSGSFLSWGAATLAGGDSHVLQGVAVPDGVGISALSSVSGYVLASVAVSQRFFWLNPGETIIDPLDFAEKESKPDNIEDMNTVGDQIIISGGASTENWYATGDLAAPFLPTQGRVYNRGVIAGTPVVVKDSLIFIGDDGAVYSVGYAVSDGAWGVHRISDHGIEERIRVQLRREQGLP
jgi:hypothetical protein